MRILVVGGAGMLGRAIMNALNQQGHQVTSFDLQASPGFEAQSLIGDVRDQAALTTACQGMDAVIHTVAYVNQSPLPQPRMYDINVTGTQNVIAACQAAGVPRLINTSSIDVVFDGSPIVNGDETLPYPAKHLDYYSVTKMQAEQAVTAANGVNGLAACTIRSAGIYGPHDRHRFPNVIPQVVKTGKYTIIGDEKAVFSHVYVENMAHAFTLAVERLSLDSPLAGQSYFITDHAPGNFFLFFKPFLKAMNIPYTEVRLSEGMAMMLANAAEALHRVTRGKPPLISRYAVAATVRDFWFTHEKARRDFGYTPLVSESDAFERTVAWARTAFLN